MKRTPIIEEQVEVCETDDAVYASSTHPNRDMGHCLYLCGVLTGAFIFLLAAFPIVRSNHFERLSRHLFWHAMDYHTHMAGQNCSVVVFGDSTATTGIDPLVIQRRTGLKTCNLALPYMALSTTGTQILDDYLAKDAAPRLIIFANHARHLRPPALDEEPGVVDGWIMVDRLLPPSRAVLFYLHHPRLTMLFMESVWQQVFTLSNTQELDLSGRSYRRDMKQLRQHNGFIPMATWETPERICSEQMPVPTYSADYVSQLEQRYGNRNTRLVVLASPVRTCDVNRSAYDQAAALLHIAPPQAYMANDFADAFHLNPTGAARYSEYVASAINSALQPPQRLLLKRRPAALKAGTQRTDHNLELKVKKSRCVFHPHQ